MEKAIEVKGPQKSCKKLIALKGVDFEVEMGIIYALLGYGLSVAPL
jgi:ABC-2 type transport system ATP-binding protein